MAKFPVKASQNIPAALQDEISGAALRIQRNAFALYDLLDRRAGPVKVKEIQEALGLGPDEYRSARQLLSGTSAELYVTQEGVVLKRFLSADDQRYWHLSWSLGLFRESGEQLVLDEDLLKRAPDALLTLFAAGKLREESRLRSLLTKTQTVMGTLAKVMDMYRNIERAIQVTLLPTIKGKDWKHSMAELKKQLKSLPPGRK
jgi:hypothetical protein